MDKENVVHLQNGVLHSGKNSDILKYAGKCSELEKNHTEWGNPDPERQI